MKKTLICIVFLLMASMFVSCDILPNGEQNMNGTKMKATITAISDTRIEVEVIEGEYGATGPYSVITSTDTSILDAEGKHISLSSLSVGDTIEITYSGQVMLSYPPQIVAIKIKLN